MGKKTSDELSVVSVDATDLIRIARSGANYKATVQQILEAKPYKLYVALLNQTGTAAPVATVLENTLGGSVVWTRTTDGDYNATLTGVFLIAKTFIPNKWQSSYGHGADFVRFTRVSNDVINCLVGDDTGNYDDMLINTPVEIRVYN